MDVAHQAPLSMRFSRREYWSELPVPPPGGLPDPGTKTASPVSPALQADSLPTEPPSYCVAKVLSLFFRINSFFPTYAKIFSPARVLFIFSYSYQSLFFFFKQSRSLSVQFSSVTQSHLTLCDPWTAACQAPCPSPTPRVYSNSCPLSWWCHPTISSSAVPLFSSLQSFPASGSFQMSLLFTSGGQNVGVSASASVLPINTQDWSTLGWNGWISLKSKGLARVFSNTTELFYSN